MRRLAGALLLLGATLLLVAMPTGASGNLPTARLTVSRAVVGARGGPVTVRAAVRHGRDCAWSAEPAIAGFAKSGPCRPAVLNRVAHIPENPLHRVRRYVFHLRVVGAQGAIHKQIAVGQAAEPRSRARACTPRTGAGTCYEAGEFCRRADRGATGVAGNGQRIVCENRNGWRWEPQS